LQFGNCVVSPDLLDRLSLTYYLVVVAKKQPKNSWINPGYRSILMTRVFLADSRPEARSALRLLLQDLNMQVVGEADQWPAVLQQAALTKPDMIVIDWDLIPTESSLPILRATCPAAVVIVLISHLDARQQAALSAGADSFISKDETPDRVAERLRAAVANIHVY
jgi:DNA-binding NarL/FixJ family response regulator